MDRASLATHDDVMAINDETTKWKGTRWLLAARDTLDSVAALTAPEQRRLLLIQATLESREIGRAPLDARYSIRREGDGHSPTWYVARFCGDRLGSEPTELAARQIALRHRLAFFDGLAKH